MVLSVCCEAEANPDAALATALALAVVDCDGASDSGLSGVSVGMSEVEAAVDAVSDAARMIDEPTSLSRLQYNVLLADNM